jgi:predicted metal-dependent hydrolase
MLEYELKKSKGRNLRIQVRPGGILVVYRPRLMPIFFVNKFLKQKEQWIREKIELQKSKSVTPRRQDKRTVRKEYLEKKELARVLVNEKLIFWKKYYFENFGINFEWKKVAIKNSTTRWGSCSSKKNLNFSFRILEIPEAQQDYLIVHELSHLLQMNHSKNFWNLVQMGNPNHVTLRREMKKINLS